jgi:hypothetical protein
MSLLENENPQVAKWFFKYDLYFTGRLNKPVTAILLVAMFWLGGLRESFTHRCHVPEYAVYSDFMDLGVLLQSISR